MSLKEPVPSKKITQAMLAGISDKIFPQQFYTLTLKDLQTLGIAGAKAAGWRFMGDVGGRDMAVHVDCDARGKSPLASQFSQGPHITSARNAMRKIVKSSEVKKHQYELRLLAIPALGMEAVWLKAGPNTPDLLVPYLAAPGLRPMRFYPVDKFLKILQQEAGKRSKFDDSPRGLRPR